ncbi:hypothetical protein [Magnetospirillum fulvum]|uniref:hypothetical protein n=1 Tax=Magnetospirillum fulvum TaxID=1082 RepID=UPI0012DFC7F9|nr:hypothetical protein [Magnetospirillum fulvum]
MRKKSEVVGRLVVLIAAAAALILVTTDAEARGGHGGRGGSHRTYHKARTTHVHIHVPKAAAAKSAKPRVGAVRKSATGGPVGGLDCARPDLKPDQLALCPAAPGVVGR